MSNTKEDQYEYCAVETCHAILPDTHVHCSGCLESFCDEHAKLTECSFCEGVFRVDCGCLTRNFKNLELDLCLNCQAEVTPNVEKQMRHMALQLRTSQGKEKIYREAYQELQEAIRTSITV